MTYFQEMASEMKMVAVACLSLALSACGLMQRVEIEQKMASIRSNCQIIHDRGDPVPEDCAKAEKIYESYIASRSTSLNTGGGGYSSNPSPAIVNVIGGFDKSGNYRSTTYINGQYSGSTYITAPKTRK